MLECKRFAFKKYHQNAFDIENGDQAMDNNTETSAYLNPIMENYECDGQLSFFDLEKEEIINDDRNRKECIAVPKSKKLLQFTLDDGTEAGRTILSGIHAFYEPEELVGKTLLAITNLPPRAMMGVESCGMLLSAIHNVNGEEKLNLVMLDDAIPAGAKLY